MNLQFFSERISLLRLDLPDPSRGGNKYFKLKYNLEEMRRQGKTRLLTFGGAFSNHIPAVAVAGKQHGFETIGLIRGDELDVNSNAVLQFAAACGMKLYFISRNKYRERNKQEFLNQLQHEFGDFYFLPEGGSNTLGAKGCSEILSGETDAFDEIVCPVGTGATLAGLIAVAKSHQHITGIALLNGKNYLEENVLQFLPAAVRCQWHIDHRFTLGGYGKTNETLTQFINSMRTLHNIPLDPVYSAKAFLALHQIAGEKSNEHKKFLFIHTGGYGINSFYKNNPR